MQNRLKVQGTFATTFSYWDASRQEQGLSCGTPLGPHCCFQVLCLRSNSCLERVKRMTAKVVVHYFSLTPVSLPDHF